LAAHASLREFAGSHFVAFAHEFAEFVSEGLTK